MEECIFTMFLHHGGQFVNNGRTLYLGGAVHEVENCSSDMISMLEIENMLREVNALEWNKIHFLVPGMDFDRGLRLLWSDKDIQNMLSCLTSLKILHIYVEHSENVLNNAENIIVDIEVIEETPLAIEGAPKSLKLVDICDISDNNVHIEELLNIDYDEDDNENQDAHEGGGASLNFENDGVSLNLEDEELCNSECESFSHLNSPIQSDDDSVEKSQHYVEFHPFMLKEKVEFTLGMKFGTLTELRDAIREYSVRCGYELIYQKNESRRITVRCQEGCSWRLHASNRQDDSTYQIKSLHSTHSCARKTTNKHVTASWLANNYLDRFRAQPEMDWKAIVDQVRSDFNICISRYQAYRARKIAMDKLEGTTKMQYAKLWDYCEELRRSNPGSTCLLSIDRPQIHMPPIFRSMYVCLKACKDGFLQGCRPIIGLDGCHLKGASHGQVLTAVGIDANDGIFPLALAVVDVESKQSWTWFLENLLDDIGPVEQKGWVFMTDQQKGLVPAIEKVAPTAEHRICLRHLYANLKKHFKGKMYKDALWNAAKATTRSMFDNEMKKLAQLDKSAFDWVNAVPTKYWAKHAFRSHSKCDMLLNNISESFNSYILEARSKPILTMFEVIRKSLMSRVHRKRELIAKWGGKLTPKIHKKLERAKQLSKNWSPRLSGGERFEVEDGKKQYIVDLNTHTCTCYMWELTGIPCPHSIQCIWFMRKNPDDYVHMYFHKHTFEITYSYYIQPINGVDLWPNTEMEPILPPLIKKLPGRPKKQRKRDPDEPSSSTKVSKKYSFMKCSKCGKDGHNIRSCKGQVKEKPLTSKLPVKRKQSLMGFVEKKEAQNDCNRDYAMLGRMQCNAWKDVVF